MKKILVASVIALSLIGSAEAHGYYRGGCCYRGGWGWGAPAVGFVTGAVVGSALAAPYYYPPVYTQPQVIVEQPPVIIQNSPAAPAGYHWQQMTNPQNGQLQTVLVPN